MEDLKKEKEKYSAELKKVNDELEKLDTRKQQITRVGVRLEGVLAYIEQKLKEASAEASKEKEADGDRPIDGGAVQSDS